MLELKVLLRRRGPGQGFLDHNAGLPLVLGELEHGELMVRAPLGPPPGVAAAGPEFEDLLPLEGRGAVPVRQLLPDFDKAGEDPALVHGALDGNLLGLLG